MLLKELFYLPKSDRSVLIVVLIAIVGITLLIFGIRGGENDVMAERKDSLDRQDTPFSSRVSYSKTYRYAEENALQTTLFPFDPNTADSTQLLRLGLRPWQVRSIYKYRARGGVYRRPEDFARLYGSHADNIEHWYLTSVSARLIDQPPNCSKKRKQPVFSNATPSNILSNCGPLSAFPSTKPTPFS